MCSSAMHVGNGTVTQLLLSSDDRVFRSRSINSQSLALFLQELALHVCQRRSTTVTTPLPRDEETEQGERRGTRC